jgi:hypothetical protein
MGKEKEYFYWFILLSKVQHFYLGSSCDAVGSEKSSQKSASTEPMRTAQWLGRFFRRFKGCAKKHGDLRSGCFRKFRCSSTLGNQHLDLKSENRICIYKLIIYLSPDFMAITILAI